MKHDRILALDGPRNFRDIGGYKNDKGKHVKWNKIYRSDSLSSLSDEDEQKLADRRITVDIDLRSKYEQNAAPDRRWPNVRYVDAHIYSENRKENKGDNKLYRFIHHIPDMGDNYLGEIYQQVLLNTHSQHMTPKSSGILAPSSCNCLTTPTAIRSLAQIKHVSFLNSLKCS